MGQMDEPFKIYLKRYLKALKDIWMIKMKPEVRPSWFLARFLGLSGNEPLLDEVGIMQEIANEPELLCVIEEE